jgi:hypothetical protein
VLKTQVKNEVFAFQLSVPIWTKQWTWKTSRKCSDALLIPYAQSCQSYGLQFGKKRMSQMMLLTLQHSKTMEHFDLYPYCDREVEERWWKKSVQALWSFDAPFVSVHSTPREEPQLTAKLVDHVAKAEHEHLQRTCRPPSLCARYS